MRKQSFCSDYGFRRRRSLRNSTILKSHPSDSAQTKFAYSVEITQNQIYQSQAIINGIGKDGFFSVFGRHNQTEKQKGEQLARICGLFAFV